jgi:hypothetical protein
MLFFSLSLSVYKCKAHMLESSNVNRNSVQPPICSKQRSWCRYHERLDMSSCHEMTCSFYNLKKWKYWRDCLLHLTILFNLFNILSEWMRENLKDESQYFVYLNKRSSFTQLFSFFYLQWYCVFGQQPSTKHFDSFSKCLDSSQASMEASMSTGTWSPANFYRLRKYYQP